jgi:two-component system sensor histidine kinase KdpD
LQALNLLENVARHTPAGTPVSVVVRKDGANAVLEVLDRGPGLPAGLDVFEKFVRGPRAAGGGVGLGLAICRGIVEAHGGQLRGANREGRGAVFSVSLPLGLVPVWSKERA